MIQHEKRSMLKILAQRWRGNNGDIHDFLDDIIQLFEQSEEKENKAITIKKIRNCEECLYELHTHHDEPCKSCDEDACNYKPKHINL